MALPYSIFKRLQTETPKKTWELIFEYVWGICSPYFGNSKPDSQVTQRDRAIGDLDLFLATAGWDLWSHYESVVPRTSTKLAQWWKDQDDGKAVLILDAFSLREAPWLLHGAAKYDLTIHNAFATGAELPADTTCFAKALGFSQRSALENNGAGSSHSLKGARTETTDIAWKDCADQIGAEPNWVFWHQWPDHRLHTHDDAGKGLSTLTQEVQEHLTGEAFWKLVERLATGRRLIITSDHGYAASGLFPDSDREQTEYLKKNFKSGRWTANQNDTAPWVPPIDIALNTQHGKNHFVLGRRKWKSAGGYPTLTHGGLSVLEVAVPFIELSKKAI